jgi:hypothetical protein
MSECASSAGAAAPDALPQVRASHAHALPEVLLFCDPESDCLFGTSDR